MHVRVTAQFPNTTGISVCRVWVFLGAAVLPSSREAPYAAPATGWHEVGFYRQSEDVDLFGQGTGVMIAVNSTHRSYNRARFGQALTYPALRWLALAMAILLWLLLVSVSTATAKTPRALLVLGVTESGQLRDDLRKGISQVLRRAGAKELTEASLTDRELLCDEAVCLAKLAKEYGVSLLVSVRIQRSASGDRSIHMFLFDATSGRDLSDRVLCSERNLPQQIQALANRLYVTFTENASEPAESATQDDASLDASGSSDEPAPTGTSSEPSNTSQADRQLAASLTLRPPTDQTAQRPLRHRKLWLGTAIGLAGLSVVLFATAVVLHRKEGQPTGHADCPEAGRPTTICAYKYFGLPEAGYGLGGLSAAGSIAAFTFFYITESRKP